MTTTTWLERAQEAFVDLMPVHLERRAWSAPRLATHQRELLRRLLGHAAARSSFHRDRLAGIDPDTFELDELGHLPVMTKAEMMDRFDDVCTDWRLTRDVVDAHVRRLRGDLELLEGDYVVFASGGSSGRRGMFVRHHTELPDYMAAVLRAGMADVAGGLWVASAIPTGRHRGSRPHCGPRNPCVGAAQRRHWRRHLRAGDPSVRGDHRPRGGEPADVARRLHVGDCPSR